MSLENVKEKIRVELGQAKSAKRFTFKKFLERKSPLRAAGLSKTPGSAASRGSSIEDNQVVEMTILDQLTARKPEPEVE